MPATAAFAMQSPQPSCPLPHHHAPRSRILREQRPDRPDRPKDHITLQPRRILPPGECCADGCYYDNANAARRMSMKAVRLTRTHATPKIRSGGAWREPTGVHERTCEKVRAFQSNVKAKTGRGQA
eukprot:6181515-Pleurochrysis_carterae.AAC.2